MEDTQSATRTERVKATSNWRDSEGRAKDDCDEILDLRVADEVRRAERDGWYLTSSRNSRYSIEHDRARNLYKCSRIRTLTLRRDDATVLSSAVNLGLSWEEYQNRTAADHSTDHVASERPSPVDDSVVGRLTESIRQVVPSTDRQRLIVGYEWNDQYPMPIAIWEWVNVPLRRVLLGDLRVIASDLRLGEESELVGLPLEESIDITPVENCASEPVSLERTIRWEEVTGYRITITQSITTTVGITGSLSFTNADGVSGELGGSLTREVLIESTREYSKTTTTSREQTLTFTVAAHKRTTISLRTQRFEARTTFEGPIVIDGGVALVYGDVTKRASVAALLDETSRTHQVSGFYSNLDTQVQPIKITEEPC